jgi:tetratricopeptide (TPR) repeat protein
MRTLILVAALTATAPTPAEEYDANTRWCEDTSTYSDRRIVACTWLIKTERLARVRLADTFYNRGTMFYEKGFRDRAIGDFDAAIRLTPDFANAYHARGMAYEDNGMFDRALRDYGNAVRLEPDFALALNSRAWLLATAPVATLRNGVEAVRVALRALRLVDFPDHHGTLAAAYAEVGQFIEAVRVQEMAIARLRATGRILSIPKFQSRLELYRAGRPYRRSSR